MAVPGRSRPKPNFRDHDRIVPAIESIHTPDVAGGNTLLTAAANDDMLVGSMAAGAGKNFRTDNVSIAMVVRHRNSSGLQPASSAISESAAPAIRSGAGL